MAEHKQDEGFKVVDRRLFTTDGELRQEVLEEERRETESARKIDSNKAGSGKGNSPEQAAPRTGPPGEPQRSSLTLDADAPKPSRNFQMLVDFMARNAAAMMGGYADPRTGQPMLDLEGAREFIDMLDVLHEKTKGNLAAEDDHLLLEVIGGLKLSFLEVSKAAAQAMTEKAKAHK